MIYDKIAQKSISSTREHTGNYLIAFAEIQLHRYYSNSEKQYL